MGEKQPEKNEKNGFHHKEREVNVIANQIKKEFFLSWDAEDRRGKKEWSFVGFPVVVFYHVVENNERPQKEDGHLNELHFFWVALLNP